MPEGVLTITRNHECCGGPTLTIYTSHVPRATARAKETVMRKSFLSSRAIFSVIAIASLFLTTNVNAASVPKPDNNCVVTAHYTTDDNPSFEDGVNILSLDNETSAVDVVNRSGQDAKTANLTAHYSSADGTFRLNGDWVPFDETLGFWVATSAFPASGSSPDDLFIPRNVNVALWFNSPGRVDFDVLAYCSRPV